MKLSPFSFPSTLDDQSVISVKRYIKSTYKDLSNLAKVETHKLRTIAIKRFVDKRCDDLLANTSLMVDSILNRKKIQ